MKLAILLLAFGVVSSCLGLILFFVSGSFETEFMDINSLMFLFLFFFGFSGALLLLSESEKADTKPFTDQNQ